jgi:rhodanese-related sulfurtransferase
MKVYSLFLLLCVAQAVQAQYQYDNVKFTTVYWDQLCQSMKQHPGYLLLDVRSKGEYEDTSQYKSLNIGHLKGARNIDINEIKNRLKEIEDYKDKPVYVYCSHSQRSRRVSKMLADSGFTQIFNINGGVSNLRLYAFKEDCHLLTTKVPYQLLSPLALSKITLSDYVILDVRPDSAFRGISTQERRNAYGRLKNSINIPLASLEQATASLPKNEKILLVDEAGADSPAAAELLHQKGFTKLTVLFNGLDAFLAEVPESERTGWTASAHYHTITALEFDALAKAGNLTVLDVRKAEEFANHSKESFRNIGNLKDAVNIPFDEWEKQFASLPADKEKPIVVYAMSSQSEVFETAKKLSAQGYRNVNVLMGGLFNLRWRAANVRGLEHLKDWVVNVPPDNP